MPRPFHQRVVRQARTPTTLLAEVRAAIAATPIREHQIREDGLLVFGVSEPDGSIGLNVPLLRVLAALHELLHHVRPDLSERAVQAAGWDLLHMLHDDEVSEVNAALVARIRATARADQRAAAATARRS